MKNRSFLRKYAAIWALTVSAIMLLPTACTREEVIPVTGVTLNPPSASLLVGNTLALEVTVAPAEATNKTVTWHTDDDRIVTVNSEGKLTAIASGTTIITATTDDGRFTATCTVTVHEEAVITMTTQASNASILLQVTKSAGSDNCAIDWGDGEKSNIDDHPFHEPNPYSDFNVYIFSHSYSGASEHRITITGDNIWLLYCAENQLTALDVSHYPELKVLYCGINLLTAFDVKNTAIEFLFCDNNPLTAFDASNNYVLKSLNVSSCPLVTLDVSNCTALVGLRISYCSLTALDVSSCTALGGLYCDYNQITNLDVSNNTELWRLSCEGNLLTAAALNDLFRTLPDIPEGNGGINIRFNPGENDCDFSIADGKGWKHWYFGMKSMNEPEELYLNFLKQLTIYKNNLK